jgi:hypothetical protein
MNARRLKMNMYPKVDGTTNVSTVLGGLWEIQKKGRTDDQHEKNGNKNKGKKDEENEFEDGRIAEENKLDTDDMNQINEDKPLTELKEVASSPARKIDIII